MNRRPEHDVLLCIGRRELAEPARERLHGLMAQPLDLDFLFRVSVRNGLMPLLYHHLKREGLVGQEEEGEGLEARRALDQRRKPEGWTNFETRLKEAYHDNARNNFILVQETLKLIRILEDAGIPVISFKGPILAQQLYGNFSLRQSCDVDLLVRREDFKRMAQLLRSHGFRYYHSNLEAEYQERLIEKGNVFSCFSPDEIYVEMHCNFFEQPTELPIAGEALWNEVCEEPFSGRKVRVLPQAWNLVELGLHTLKHQWFKLEWFAGIQELQRQMPEAEIRRAREIAGAVGAGDLLDAALEVANRIFMPDAGRRASPRSVQKMARIIERSLWGTGNINAFQIMKLRWSEPRSFQHKVRLTASTLFSPSAFELAQWPMPKPLHFLYPLLRGYRLVGKYAFGRKDG